MSKHLHLVFIYLLRDPETLHVRYVGKTINTKVRFALHLAEKKGTHKNNWLHSLKSRGLRPIFEVIETIENSDDTDWQPREIYWISHYRSLGEPLTNLDGGGTGGRSRSEETKEKMSLAMTGKRHTPESIEKIRIAKSNPSAETRERLRKANLGKKQTPETIEKRREKMLGHECSEEVRLKIGAKNRGRKRSDEARAKIRAARAIQVFSDESKMKMGAAHIGKTLSSEHLAKINRTGMKASPQTIERMRQSHLGRKLSQETKAKMATAQRARHALRKSLTASQPHAAFI
jgi:group I intron endonuclease